MLSAIKSEIEKYMTGSAKEGTALTSRFAFSPEFIGFQGHFPEKKILPGVCQIQCAISTFEAGTGRAAKLKEVVLAKYYSPVYPDEEVTCVVSDAGNTGEIVIKAVITKQNVKVADLKLRIAVAERGGTGAG